MSDPIRDTMIEFDDSLWAMAAEINRQRAEIARLTATLDGDPHQTATPEQRRAWRSSAIKYADRLETEVARLTAELAAANDLVHEQDVIYMGHYRTVQEIRKATEELFAFIETHADRSFLSHGKSLMEFRARIMPRDFPNNKAIAAHRARVGGGE